MKKILILAVVIFSMASAITDAQIASIAAGNWSNIETWGGGVVPAATDDVVISAGNTVTVDVDNAECKNLSIDGTMTFPDVEARSITVNGSVIIGATGKFNTYSSGSPTALRNQKITIMEDLTVTTGGIIDMRRGSNPNVGIGTIEFAGSVTSNISLSQTSYGSSIEEFNGITINKTGGAKVILKTGNLYMSNNTSTGPTYLTFISGMIETEGTSVWGYMTTNTVGIVGTSSSSFVKGNLGRGMSNSAGATRIFYVGDDEGFRPITLRSSTPQGATGAMLIVTSVLGDANNSSTFVGGIDKVSEVRYFKVRYYKGASGAASLTLDSLAISYGLSDGVSPGNINLRAAYSTDERATWTAVQQTEPYVTETSDTSRVGGDMLSPGITLTDGQIIYLALARVSGTTENSLSGLVHAVEKENGIPSFFMLDQNYPNPFNPSTKINFSVPLSGIVRLSIYNALGQTIEILVDEFLDAGSYHVNFDAGKLTSGIYYYQIQANGYSQTKKMSLVK
ncbi:MAG: hypothetical protein COW85_13835 [Ignavibacteria bacterium CG22_combo_CG10-13_8_21_14_all_37_15]|nr:MAG: hypothetical protein COW85_13835 [Ignavibacteria bacterium CG22_combo_CG10-13_8_21_14_all_37_15]